MTLQKIILAFTLLLSSLISLNADFIEGQKIFESKCATCHSKHVSMKILKENFFEKNNTLLNLKYPSVNMLVYAITRSSKRIGDETDPEMQQVEIEEYLMNYVEDTSMDNTICEDSIIKYYEKREHKNYNLSEDDFSNLAIFFMEYKKNREKKYKKKVLILSDGYDEEELLEAAKTENKKLLIYATSKTCHFCKKMDKEVLSLKDVKEKVNKDFIFIKVDVDTINLPFNLKKGYKGMTPTFFVVDENAKLLNKYPGSWNKTNFLLILKENLK